MDVSSRGQSAPGCAWHPSPAPSLGTTALLPEGGTVTLLLKPPWAVATAPSQTQGFPSSLPPFPEGEPHAIGGLASVSQPVKEAVISTSSPEGSHQRIPSRKGRRQTQPTGTAGKSHFLKWQHRRTNGRGPSQLRSLPSFVPQLSQIWAPGWTPSVLHQQGTAKSTFRPSPPPSPPSSTNERQTKKSSLYCLINKRAWKGKRGVRGTHQL